MKYCPRCEQTKPLSDFGLHRKMKDGHYYHCRRCRQLQYGTTAKAKDSEKARQFEREQYEKHKEARKMRDRERYVRSTPKTRARKAVHTMIAHGQLLSANQYPCAVCGETARDHHHPSYHEDDYLKVVPLCRSCHVRAHHDDELAASVATSIVPINTVRIIATVTQQ